MSQESQSNTPQCHGQHRNGHGHGKHMIFMILGCLIVPVLLTIGPKSGVLAKLSWLVPLLCPLMMIGMMIPMMFKGKDKKDTEKVD